LHRRHADLPPALTPADFLPKGTTDDLVAETDSDQPHSVLFEEDFLGEIDQFEDPDVVVEGVETCVGDDISLLELLQRSTNQSITSSWIATRTT